MSAVKFNNDKETAIEFHQLARDFGSKYPKEISNIYLDKMQTAEGKAFVKDYIKHKTAIVKLGGEKAVLTKGLTAIEENKPIWKNNYPNKSAAADHVASVIKDDVNSMTSKTPHPQLTEAGYEFKHFSAEVSVENSISKEKAAGLESSLKNVMSNLLKKGMSKEEIKTMTEQAPDQKMDKVPVVDKSKSAEITV